MAKIQFMSTKKLMAAIIATTLSATIAGCGASTAASAETRQQTTTTAIEQTSEQASEQTESADSAEETVQQEEIQVASANVITTSLDAMVSDGVIDTSDLFTDRDLEQEADLVGATYISLVSGQDVIISEEGVYVLTGTVEDVTVSVDAEAAKVQLVLDGANITNQDAPAIYVKNADKVFVTTTEGSQNTLTVNGEFTADGETNTDAVIFSKDDLVLNGLGTLTISSTGNGITSKDDLKITGGTYVLDTSADAIEANDSIRIADGTFSISSYKDALHAENDEDDSVGYIYICGGTFDISASDDGIQGTTYVQIDGGTLNINSVEAIEATYVQFNGGDVNITASDDGVNASAKSTQVTPTLEVRGGNLTVSMAQGDTDALDSNGYIIVSGGTIDITAQFPFDFVSGSQFTGGTIYVNGEQVSEIVESMMMGGGMMGGPGEGMMGGPGGGGQGW